VLNLFNKVRQPNDFQQHIRDFLIELREWGSHEDALYERERQASLRQESKENEGLRLGLRYDGELDENEEEAFVLPVQVPTEAMLKSAIDEFALLQWGPHLSRVAGQKGMVKADELADTSEDAICAVNFPTLGMFDVQLPSRILRVLPGPLSLKIGSQGQQPHPHGLSMLSALEPRGSSAECFLLGVLVLLCLMLAVIRFKRFRSFQQPVRGLWEPLLHSSLSFDIF